MRAQHGPCVWAKERGWAGLSHHGRNLSYPGQPELTQRFRERVRCDKVKIWDRGAFLHAGLVVSQ